MSYKQLKDIYIDKLEHCVSLLERRTLQKSATESVMEEIAQTLSSTPCIQSSIVDALQNNDASKLVKLGTENRTINSLGTVIKNKTNDKYNKYSQAERELYSRLNLI